MPNHIYTTATIFGPTDALTTIHDLADNGKSVLAHFLPLPADACEERTYTQQDGTTFTSSVFAPGGYEMAVDLWGSKWADYEVEVLNDDRQDAKPSITLRFQSAWSPVVEGYTKLSTMLGITAVLTYEDECHNYLGATGIKDGRVISEEYYDGSKVDEHPLFAEVPEQPSDWNSDEWYQWNSDYSEAWSALLVECEDNVWAAIGLYEEQEVRV